MLEILSQLSSIYGEWNKLLLYIICLWSFNKVLVQMLCLKIINLECFFHRSCNNLLSIATILCFYYNWIDKLPLNTSLKLLTGAVVLYPWRLWRPWQLMIRAREPYFPKKFTNFGPVIIFHTANYTSLLSTTKQIISIYNFPNINNIWGRSSI